MKTISPDLPVIHPSGPQTIKKQLKIFKASCGKTALLSTGSRDNQPSAEKFQKTLRLDPGQSVQ